MPYLIALILVIIQGIITLGHWLIYKTVVRFLVITDPKVLLTLKIGLGVLSVCFVLASLISFRYYNKATQIFYTLSAGWLGFFYFLFLAICLFWIIFGLSRFLSIDLNPKMLLPAFLMIAVVLGTYGIFNAANVRVKNLEITLPNLPSEWKGKTAVWISDIHLGQVRNEKFAAQMADLISRQKPDIIFIGGDLYDGVAVDTDKVIMPFANLHAPLGTYFITGNHEEFSDNTKYLAAIKRAGIEVLNNEAINLEGLQIIGVDYSSTGKPEALKNILENLHIDKAKPSILLKHEPSELNIAEEQGINFQISGHTHQGQVPIFNWATKRLYHGFNFGLKNYGKMLIYTSSGAGTWGPPMRVVTTPEIVVISFK